MPPARILPVAFLFIKNQPRTAHAIRGGDHNRRVQYLRLLSRLPPGSEGSGTSRSWRRRRCDLPWGRALTGAASACFGELPSACCWSLPRGAPPSFRVRATELSNGSCPVKVLGSRFMSAVLGWVMGSDLYFALYAGD